MSAKTMVSLVVLILLLTAGTATFSQTGGAPLPPANTSLDQLEPVNSSTPSTPEMEAERAQIWNSPAMLRARAWLQEYCQHSARVTPEEAQHYQTELQRMTPTQLKLWLLKFNHAEEMMQQRQAAFEMSRRASVQQALGIDRGVQQAYGRINRDETEAAETQQASVNEEQQYAQQNAQNKAENLNFDSAAGVGDFGYGYPLLGDGSYPPVHYHYHFHY
jgi:hypothetical protein